MAKKRIGISGGIAKRKAKRITPRQKIARQKNIAIARKFIKRKGTGDKYYTRKAILFDKRVSVSRGIGSKKRKAIYKKAFKKSYLKNKGMNKTDRTITAHEYAYQSVTGRTIRMRSSMPRLYKTNW